MPLIWLVVEMLKVNFNYFIFHQNIKYGIKINDTIVYLY